MKKTTFATSVCYFPLCYCSLRCNVIILSLAWGLPSDTGVKVSQLDVDQAHQPQGGLSRLEPLYATEYSCPLQYPRVVSVYPAMLIAQHQREGSTRRNGSLSNVEMSSLKWSTFKMVYLQHRAPNVAWIEG